MRLEIKREELKKTEILEFRGEFEEIREVPMHIEENRVYFTSSFVEGEIKKVNPIVVLKREGLNLMIHSLADKIILFNNPPKYITKKVCR